jgi:cytochrome P450/nitrite reductase/ring-hydroxylating ferredoxin subunit
MAKTSSEQQPTSAVIAPGALVELTGSGEIIGNGPHALSAGGVDLVLVRTAAGTRVFGGRCPHQGALLGEGELDGDALVCRNHRWRFDAQTGQRSGGPQCLTACPVVEEAGAIRVDLAPLAASSAAAAPSGAAGTGPRSMTTLPGPKGLPLLGNTLQLDLPRLHLVLEGWAAEHGPMYLFRMGRRPLVVVSDPDLNQEVMRARPETYRRTSQLELVFEELGVAGVFSAEGGAWRAQRRLAMEALSHRHPKGFYPTLRTVAERLRGRWAGAAARGDRLNVTEELKRLTVDITTALTFGHDINTIEQTGDDVIQRRLELLFPAFNRRIFATVPLWRLVRLPADRRLDRAVTELREWLGGLVRAARARLADEPDRAERPANFLEAMLAARDDAGQPFSDRVIFGNLMTMLLAGEDTTAYTVAWAVHHLCDSPASVAALAAELDRVLGDDGVPRDIESANRLTYAGAVANEAMRLRPVAPVIFAESLVATTLGGVAIPARTTVVSLTRVSARDGKNFDAPDVFRPERWLADVGGGAARGAHDPSAFIPFGSGPRICPGRTLALLEMKVALALIYKNFAVARSGRSEEVREAFAFTMSPEGLAIALERRAS